MLLQEIQNRASFGVEEDSLEYSKVPITSGLLQKREAKMSAKKSELYLRILKEHGIDAEAQSKANRLNYELPSLGPTMLKSRTPVTQIIREVMTDSHPEK